MNQGNQRILTFEIPIRKMGSIMRRSEHLHNWKKRFYEINNNLLSVAEDDSLKDPKVLDLTEYELKWIDRIDKTRFAFSLTTTNKNAKIKQLILGDEKEAIARDLFQKLVECSAYIKQLSQKKLGRNAVGIYTKKEEVTELADEPYFFHRSDDTVFNIPDDVPEWVQETVAQQGLDKEDSLIAATESNSDWNLFHKSDNVRIFQSTEEPSSFKLFARYKSIKPLDLLQLLVDYDSRKAWDQILESSRSISKLPTSKVNQMHTVLRPYGKAFFPHESITTRVIFATVGKFFIVEKSLENDEDLPKNTIYLTRNTVKYSVMRVSAATEGGAALMLQLSQINCPDIAPEANANLTKAQLMQLLKLESIDVDETLTTRQEFAAFLRHFRAGLAEEEKEDEEFDNQQRRFVKEMSSNEVRSVDSEILKKIEHITSGKVANDCVDVNIPYPEISEELKNKRVPDQPVHWLLGTDFKRDPSVGLEVLNQEWINSQKKVLGFIIKGMGKNLLEGKSIMGMALPISIFSKDSILQRAAKCITYAPLILKKAAEIDDPLEQFKLAVAFYFTMLHISVEQQKPFNPILGETYQGLIGGVPVFLEQVSHHPPISYINYKTEDYFVYGTYKLEAQLGANSASALQKGRIMVRFTNTGNEITCIIPTAVVSGVMVGKRTMNWAKKMKVFDTKHNLYAELHCHPDEKGLISGLFSRKKEIEASLCRGKIWKVKKDFTSQLWDKSSKKEAVFNERDHAVETVCPVLGNWTTYLDIDDKRYWSLDEERPFELVDYPGKKLPSDSSYRQDLIFRSAGEDNLGQEWKEKLENIQRADRKLRAKATEKKK